MSLSSIDMNTVATLRRELYNLKLENDKSNEFQVIISWLEKRIKTIEAD